MSFNIYIKLLEEMIQEFGARLTPIYTTHLCVSLTVGSGSSVEFLNRCLEKVIGWMRDSKLKVNPDRMLLATRESAQGLWMHPLLERFTLPLKDQDHSLGVLKNSTDSCLIYTGIKGRGCKEVLGRELNQTFSKSHVPGCTFPPLPLGTLYGDSL